MSNDKPVNEKSVKNQNKSSTDQTQSGNGGELHQLAGGEHSQLTTNQGVGISDNQNSLKANPRTYLVRRFYPAGKNHPF